MTATITIINQNNLNVTFQSVNLCSFLLDTIKMTNNDGKLSSIDMRISELKPNNDDGGDFAFWKFCINNKHALIITSYLIFDESIEENKCISYFHSKLREHKIVYEMSNHPASYALTKDLISLSESEYQNANDFANFLTSV